jgi:hypothetical protein
MHKWLCISESNGEHGIPRKLCMLMITNELLDELHVHFMFRHLMKVESAPSISCSWAVGHCKQRFQDVTCLQLPVGTMDGLRTENSKISVAHALRKLGETICIGECKRISTKMTSS